MLVIFEHLPGLKNGLNSGTFFVLVDAYQRKLGRNTSVLRTNGIVRLDIGEGWCATWHHITIHHKRIDIDAGWCATWHRITTHHKRTDPDEGWCASWHHITIHHKRIDIAEGRCQTWHQITIHHKRIIGCDKGVWDLTSHSNTSQRNHRLWHRVVTKGSGD